MGFCGLQFAGFLSKGVNMEKYNGWTNYATWRVNLEMFDGFDPFDYFSDNQADFADCLPDYLKQYAEDFLSDTTPQGLALDYSMAFLGEVNWHEIAKNMLSAYA